MNLSFFDFEHFRELPSPRVHRTSCYSPAVRRFKRAVLTERMIKESEAEDESPFPVDGDVAPVVYAPHEVN